MKLYNLVAEDCVLLDLRGEDGKSVLSGIAAVLEKKDRTLRKKGLVEKLLQREALGSTAIGDGVAIPHCKIKGVKAPLVAVGVSAKGVDFASLDGKPTRIFFVIVASSENPALNLQILAAIAQLVRKADALPTRIFAARTAGDVMNIIKEEEDKANG